MGQTLSSNFPIMPPSTAEIAALVGRDRSRVAQILKAHGATTRPAGPGSTGMTSHGARSPDCLP